MGPAEAARTGPATAHRSTGPIGAALRELALVAALFLAYKAARVAVAGRVATALANGDRVWRLERLLGLPDEAALQHPLLAHDLLVRLANGYYAYVHFPATALCLVWLYLRRRRYYRWARRALAALTAAALALHLLVPLAPPRLTALTGLVDTGRRYGPAVYGPAGADGLSNQYAAMPSLHVGWALAVAIALVAATRGRLRWLWLAHPLLTLLVVVGTGNHYWLDALVAAAMLAVVLLLLPAPVPDRPGGAALRSRAGRRPHRVAARRTAGAPRRTGLRRRCRSAGPASGRRVEPAPGRGQQIVVAAEQPHRGRGGGAGPGRLR